MKRSSLLLVAMVLFIACLAQASSAASVTVAPGANIQSAANSLAGSGGDVKLSAGTHSVSSTIALPAGVNLIGAGDGATVVKFTQYAWLLPQGNNRLAGFTLTGRGHIQIRASNVACEDITARVEREAYAPAAFYVMAENKVIENISFVDYHAIDCDTYGFLCDGSGTVKTIRNTRFSGCTALNSGRYDRPDSFVVGFDLAEGADIDGMLVENCRAEGSWETGFHFEWKPAKSNVILKNCVSRNNAQKYWTGGQVPTFGAGFLASKDIQLFDCVSEGNYKGYWLLSNVLATRCTDNGSVNGFSTETGWNIQLTDCGSTNAKEWALYAASSGNVVADNFRVTNPLGHAYPAVTTSSSKNVVVNLASGDTSSAPVSTSAPVASFRADITGGTSPLTVRFTDTSTGSPTAWSWDCNSNGYIDSTQKNPMYTFQVPGTYTVTMTARNAAGSNTRVQTAMIMVRA